MCASPGMPSVSRRNPVETFRVQTSMTPRISALPCLAATLLLLLGLSVPGHAQRAGQENFISRAAFGDGRLWLLTDAGDLSSITPGEKVRMDARLPVPVLDICAASGAIRALACSSPSCDQWAFYTSTDGDDWSLGTTVPSNGDHIVALDCVNTQDTVVTNRRLVTIGGDTVASVALSDPLPSGAVTTAHATDESVFVGVNAGEFGGGLRRIDRRTGVVASIDRNTTGDLCGGPLNPECDPVTGITDVPWKPSCVAVAIGLVHFLPHGRMVEMCGEDVQSVYFKPFEIPDPRWTPKSGH
jgi:hypothetical protein